jgi:anti-sigma B factor antagonist
MSTDTLRLPTETAPDTAEVMLPVAVVAATAPEVRALLHRAVDAGTGLLVLDLSAVERLDVVGLGVLMGAHRRGAGMGRPVRVVRPTRRVAAMLRVTGLDRVLCPRRDLPPSPDRTFVREVRVS